jgi:hypothetical protein
MQVYKIVSWTGSRPRIRDFRVCGCVQKIIQSVPRIGRNMQVCLCVSDCSCGHHWSSISPTCSVSHSSCPILQLAGRTLYLCLNYLVLFSFRGYTDGRKDD